MKDDKYLLTEDNYLSYLETEKLFYSSFDYEELNYQIDYEDDIFMEENIDYEG